MEIVLKVSGAFRISIDCERSDESTLTCESVGRGFPNSSEIIIKDGDGTELCKFRNSRSRKIDVTKDDISIGKIIFDRVGYGARLISEVSESRVHERHKLLHYEYEGDGFHFAPKRSSGVLSVQGRSIEMPLAFGILTLLRNHDG